MRRRARLRRTRARANARTFARRFFFRARIFRHRRRRRRRRRRRSLFLRRRRPRGDSARGSLLDASALGTARLSARLSRFRGSALGGAPAAPASRSLLGGDASASSFASRFFVRARLRANKVASPPSRAVPTNAITLPGPSALAAGRHAPQPPPLPRGTAGWRIVPVVRAVHEGPSRLPVSRNTRSERQRVASVAVSADAPATGGSASGVALGVVSSGAPGWTPDEDVPSHARFVPADRLGGGRSLRGHDGLRFVRIVLLRRGRAGAARFVIRPPPGEEPRRAAPGRATRKIRDGRQGRSRVRGRERLVGTPVARRDARAGTARPAATGTRAARRRRPGRPRDARRRWHRDRLAFDPARTRGTRARPLVTKRRGAVVAADSDPFENDAKDKSTTSTALFVGHRARKCRVYNSYARPTPQPVISTRRQKSNRERENLKIYALQ